LHIQLPLFLPGEDPALTVMPFGTDNDKTNPALEIGQKSLIDPPDRRLVTSRHAW
jgi:hypothetical protein